MQRLLVIINMYFLKFNNSRLKICVLGFQIIHKIMEFLSNSDLESASMVNPAWEGAALKHLLVRNPVDINLRNVTDPSDVLLPLINLSPSNVRIFSHEVPVYIHLFSLLTMKNYSFDEFTKIA